MAIDYYLHYIIRSDFCRVLFLALIRFLIGHVRITSCENSDHIIRDIFTVCVIRSASFSLPVVYSHYL